MKIIKDKPPNYELIKLTLSPPEHAIYCYGNKIYNPSGKELTPDLEYHESIHSKQQGNNPDLWYNKYLTDKDFRLEQELEAYGEQYLFIKEHISNNKLRKWSLEKMAEALSNYYKLNIPYQIAESKIRNYGKNIKRRYAI